MKKKTIFRPTKNVYCLWSKCAIKKNDLRMNLSKNFDTNGAPRRNRPITNEVDRKSYHQEVKHLLLSSFKPFEENRLQKKVRYLGATRINAKNSFSSLKFYRNATKFGHS